MLTQRFLEDAINPVEKLYGDKIAKHLPAYVKFWEKYVGAKSIATSVDERTLSVLDPKHETLNRELKLFQQDSLTLVHHFAYAMLSLESLHKQQATPVDVAPTEASVMYWKDYGEFCHWLGAAHYKCKSLKNRLTKEGWSCGGELDAELDKVEAIKGNCRDLLVHQLLFLFRYNKDTREFEIPSEFPKACRRQAATFAEIIRASTDWVSLKDKANADFARLATLVNTLYEVLTEFLNQSLCGLDLGFPAHGPSVPPMRGLQIGTSTGASIPPQPMWSREGHKRRQNV